MQKNKKSANEIIIYTILTFSLLVFMMYILFFYNSLYIDDLETEHILTFIKSFDFLLASLAIISCITCFNSNNKEELFIIALSFMVFLVDLLFGNVDGFIYNKNNVLESSHILFENSLLRILMLSISVLNFKKIRKIILKNKIKTEIFILFISTLINIFNNLDILGTKLRSEEYFINYNIFLFLFYLFLSFIYFSKSINQKEYIYAVIGASFFIFSLKWISYIHSMLFESLYTQVLSISITYIAFMILVCGLVFELLFKTKKNKDLQDENFIFKKMTDENVHSCILIFDKNNKVRYMNNKARDYFNGNDEGIYESILKKLDLIDKEYIKYVLDILNEKKYWSGPLEIKTLDEFINCMVQILEYDKEILTIVMFRNVTKRMREQRELIEYEKYKQQENIRNEFFANISHDLKTPINIFYSTVQLLDKKKDEEDFISYYTTHSKFLKNNCQRMIKLINNTLDVTKPDMEFIKPKFINIDIVMVVEGITQSVLNYANQKQIKVIFDTEVEEHIIKADVDMIERIVLNLLSNAIKFTDKNGHIWVNIYIDNKYVKIVVADDGIGIPLDMQSKIFDRFIQNDKSIKKSQGSGIGLSIVESMVRSSGGKIELFSDGKKGTTFEIYLPNEKLIKENQTENSYLIDEEKVDIELSDAF